MKTTKTIYSFDELMSLLRTRLPHLMLDCFSDLKQKMHRRGVTIRNEVESTILKEHLFVSASTGSLPELPSPVSFSLRQVDIEREIIVDMQPCGTSSNNNQARLMFRWISVSTTTIMSSVFNSRMLNNETILDMLADFFKNNKCTNNQILFVEQFNLLTKELS